MNRTGLLSAALALTLPLPWPRPSDGRVLALEGMAAKSGVAWGQSAGVVVFVDDTSIQGTTTRAWASRGYPVEGGQVCVIGLSPEFWDERLTNEEQKQTLVTHEYGHCLGLGDYYGVQGMIMGLSSATITEVDRAQLRRTHGRSIAMVASD